MRAPRRLSPTWHEYDFDTPPERVGGEQPAPDLTESERTDRVTLYGPKGEVLRRHIDRPFLGYSQRRRNP